MTNSNSEILITLTADIVSAHLSHNVVAVGDVPALIGNVHSALSGLGSAEAAAPAKAEPAVSIRSSVKPDSITCLECGRKAKILKRHLFTAHDLTTDEYREKWNLPASYPLVAPNYATSRKELALKIGLGKTRGGRRPGRKPKAVAG